MVRASAVGKCRYDPNGFSDGAEDCALERLIVGASSDALGDFWLCLAESNAWGGTIVRLTAWPSDLTDR